MLERDREGIDYVLHSVRENDVKFIRLWFTDMPKPVYGINGSGMHTHQSLSRATATSSTIRTSLTDSPLSPDATSPDCFDTPGRSRR